MLIIFLVLCNNFEKKWDKIRLLIAVERNDLLSFFFEKMRQNKVVGSGGEEWLRKTFVEGKKLIKISNDYFTPKKK